MANLYDRIWFPYSRFFLRAAIILCALALCAVAGYSASAHIVAAGLIGAWGIIVLLLKPHWGIAILPMASIAIPWQVGTGTVTALNAAVLLIPIVLAAWVARLFYQKKVMLVPSPINLPLGVFVLSASVSLAAGNASWNYFAQHANWKAQMGGWLLFTLSASAMLLAGNLITDTRWLAAPTWIFLALGSVKVLGRIWPVFSVVSDRLVVNDATGGLFWIWLAALAAGQSLFNRTLNLFLRVGLAGLAVATLGVGWFLSRDWVSGWLPTLVTLIALLWLRSWRLALVVTLTIWLCAIGFAPDILNDIFAADEYSINTRQVAWEILMNQVLPTSPILGLGPANYYHYTALYPIMGYYVRFNSHNQYVDILAQTGLVGLIAFGWLMASIGRLGWALRERCGDGFARGYVYGCLGGLAGTLAAGALGDWFLPFVYNIGLAGFRASVLGWLFLGGLIALSSIAQSQPQQGGQ